MLNNKDRCFVFSIKSVCVCVFFFELSSHLHFGWFGKQIRYVASARASEWVRARANRTKKWTKNEPAKSARSPRSLISHSSVCGSHVQHAEAHDQEGKWNATYEHSIDDTRSIQYLFFVYILFSSSFLAQTFISSNRFFFILNSRKAIRKEFQFVANS